MKTIVITRKYWGTGCLLDNDGKKCCLGFVSIGYGYSEQQIHSLLFPYEIAGQRSKLPKWLKWLNNASADMFDASKINDSIDLTWAQKEEQLKPLFAKHGIRLVFRGKR